jgi:hypothetical protein
MCGMNTPLMIVGVLLQFHLPLTDLILVCRVPNIFQSEEETACILGYLWN